MTARIDEGDHAGRPVERAGAAFVLVAAALWAGMLVGVSFIATPAKFLAPSLTLPVALDIGRQTFSVFSKVEIVSAIILALLVFTTMRHLASIAVALLLAAIVAIEAALLIPMLDARVSMIIAGETPPPSSLHFIYVLLEAVKFILLGLLIVPAARLLSAGRTIRL